VGRSKYSPVRGNDRENGHIKESLRKKGARVGRVGILGNKKVLTYPSLGRAEKIKENHCLRSTTLSLLKGRLNKKQCQRGVPKRQACLRV